MSTELAGRTVDLAREHTTRGWVQRSVEAAGADSLWRLSPVRPRGSGVVHSWALASSLAGGPCGRFGAGGGG
jgi:hypothetical protein